MNLFVFLVSLGAALRLTRLATTDNITQPWRQLLMSNLIRAHQKLNDIQVASTTEQPTARKLDGPRLALASRRVQAWSLCVQLFECPWCIGFWISTAVVAAALSPLGTGHHIPTGVHLWLFVFPALALATSYLVGVVNELLELIRSADTRLARDPSS